jgi:hypothetical protein
MSVEWQGPEPAQIVLYQTADGRVTVDVRFARDNFWLTQKAMAELFGVKVPAVNKHLKNIFASGELVEDSVISILETTATDGKDSGGDCLRAGRQRDAFHGTKHVEELTQG